MKKTKNIIFLFSCMAFLIGSFTGCGSTKPISDSSLNSGNSGSPTFEATVSDSTNSNETLSEDTQLTNTLLIIPDYHYDEYLTVSADDNTPAVGYNIPVGWTSENKGVWTTISKAGITEQSFNIMFNQMSSIKLSEIENNADTEFITTEHSSVETPIGIFRIFTLDYIADNHMDAQYAIMPVTDEIGVTVYFSYTDGLPHFYQGTIDLLLLELFGQKQPPVEIPDSYQCYLQSHTGVNILGANPPEGYKHSDYDSILSEYETILSFSPSDPNSLSSISISEYDVMAPIYSGITDVLTWGWVPDTNEIANYEYYTEKGTYETPYGVAKLYDVKTDTNPALNPYYQTHYTEIALLRLNGSYIQIIYNAETRDIPTNNIETILSQLF